MENETEEKVEFYSSNYRNLLPQRQLARSPRAEHPATSLERFIL